MKYPFIFIAGLMRSGTTLLLEILTKLPYSFIINEPGLCNGNFNTSPNLLIPFKENGIDIHKIVGNKNIRRKFRNKVLPLLENHVMQIGIKEIWTKDWNKFLEIFPDSKIIVTARDPRDLYISVYYWRNRKSNTQNKYLSNRRKKLIENQMRSQIKLIENMSCYKLKYEHLCKNPDVIVNEIKDYVNSPIPDIGDIGKYLESLSKRKNEYRKHKNEITTKSIEKWKTEKDKKLVENCNEFFDSIPWYCDFWDYRRKKNG